MEDAGCATATTSISSTATKTATTSNSANLDHRSSVSSRNTRDYTQNIKDYDSLRYMQLRYIFSDYEFVSSMQWKAMQRAGWTYGQGIYRSPGGTRRYHQVHDLRHHLDAALLLGPDSNTTRPDDGVPDDDSHLENIQDLRNDICYHLQLLHEQKNIHEDDNDDDVMVVAGHEVDNVNHRSNHSSRPEVAVMDNSSRRQSTRPTTSMTAIETGTNLYLHKRQPRKQPPRITTADPSSSHPTNRRRRRCPPPTLETTTTTTRPPLPTPQDCANLLLSTWRATTGDLPTLPPHYKFLITSSGHHSLLLYGNGSKYDVLSKFCDDLDGYVLQIHGYDSHVSMQGLLDLCVATFLNGVEPEPLQFVTTTMTTISVIGTHRTTVHRAMAIANALAEFCRVVGTFIYFVIHSLDGNLATPIEQEALAALIGHSFIGANGNSHQTRAIRLVASVDHVDAIAALWSTDTWNQFSWTFLNVNTDRPYIREMALLESTTTNRPEVSRRGDSNTINGESSSKAEQRRWKQLSRASQQSERVLQVRKNLAPRYGEVMQILAELQVSEMKQLPLDCSTSSTSPVWVDYKVFRTACRSRFVIDKDSKLRTLQTELSDHHLLISKNVGSTEYVSIPYSMDKLQEIISYRRNADL